MTSIIKKTLAGIGTAGALLVGASAPIMPAQISVTDFNNMVLVINHEAQANGGTVNVVDPQFVDGKLSLSSVLQQIANTPVTESTVALSQNDVMSKDDYQKLKTSLVDDVKNKSLLDKINL